MPIPARTHTRSAVSQTEYGIIGAVISVICIAAVESLGKNLGYKFCIVSGYLSILFPGMYGCGQNEGYGQGATYSISVSPSISCSQYGGFCGKGITSVDAQMLYEMNLIDPVTSVYGIEDSKGQAITDYQTAINNLQMGQTTKHGVNNPYTNQSYQYEVQTKSGAQYAIFNDPSGYGLGFRNLVTNDTWMYKSGAMQYVGKTQESGNL